MPDALGNKPVIDFDPPPCTYDTMVISGSPGDPSKVVGYCAEGTELNYSAFTVNDWTAGCPQAILNTYCPRERMSLKNLTVNVLRGLAGPPTLTDQANYPPIGSQSVIMLMNCGDCKVEDTDLLSMVDRGVSQDGITFGAGSTGHIGSTGATQATIVGIAKVGLYLTPSSGIHVDASGTTDDTGVSIDNVSVSACGGCDGWGSGISISGTGGTVSNCTVAYNNATGVFVASQPLGPEGVASNWIAVQSTLVTDCEIHDNGRSGVLISSTASAEGIDFVPEDTVLTRVNSYDNKPYDGIRIEGGRHVTISDGTFHGNSVGITLANQSYNGTPPASHDQRIDGMTSDITISGVISHDNTNYELLLLAVDDVSVQDTLLYNPASSTSPAIGKAVGLWGNHRDSNTYENREIALNDLNIGENGIHIHENGTALSGIYSLTGKVGPSNPSGSPNTYANGDGLHAPKGSTYVDSTHGVTYWKSTGPTDPTGWVTSGPQKIVAGYAHTCALLADGTVQCWGYNLSGQLGLGAGSPTIEYAPTQVSSLSHVVDIAAGSYHTCALNHDGEVYCWGDNRVRDSRISDTLGIWC